MDDPTPEIGDAFGRMLADYLLAAPDRMADLASDAWTFDEAIGTDGSTGDYVGLLEYEP